MIYTLPEEDLKHILDLTAHLWEELKNEKILISGGTGFFGSWLTESFLYANDHLKLGAQAIVLTRRPQAVLARIPQIARHPAIELCAGDIRNFKYSGGCRFIVHAANESTSQIQAANPEKEEFEIITKGTEHILEFAEKSGCRKLLFTSSGAAYGRQPSNIPRLSEDFQPDSLSSLTAYGKGKRTAEDICIAAAAAHTIETKIARCFCFIGPYLPLDVHFAAGNFIRDALKGGPVHVNGDGTPLRSYLYMSDLAIWLWTILFQGKSGRPYNVGSEEAVSIAELARRVTGISQLHSAPVIHQTADPNVPPERYIPDTTRAREELGLQQRISLDEAIDKTLSWHKGRGQGAWSGPQK